MVGTGDVKFYKSASSGLGGAISATVIQSGSSNNFFSMVPQTEEATGDDYYLLAYVKNTHASETMKAFSLWLTADSGLGYEDSSVKWAKGTTGKNGVEQTIANKYTSPVGVTWLGLSNFEPVTRNIGDLAPGDFFPIWIWRHIEPNSTARRDDRALFEFAFDITTTGSGTGGGGGGSGIVLDQFGVRQMFATKTGGKEWSSILWNNGHSRTLSVNTYDPDDPNLGFHVATTATTRTLVINGDGTATMPETMAADESRRIFINGPWTNTEITYYARWRTTIYQSLQLRSRSNHHGTSALPYGYDSSNDISCGFGNYNVKWSEAGDTKIDVEVEVIHDLYRRHLDEHDYTLPAINTWTGFKQITRTIGTTVNVQGWINYGETDQANGWIKQTEFTFDGNNVTVDPTGHELNVSTCLNQGDKVSGELDKNTLWLNPGKWCWTRINGGDDIDLKSWSVREIAGEISTGGGGGGNPPPPATNYKIAVAGDWGCGSTTDKVHDLAAQYDYIIGVGDNAYASASCWTSTFSDVKSKMISAFGNHEYEESGGITPYMTFFGYSKTYLSKDFQNVHILIVDTNIDMSSGSAQHTFVENDLNAASANPNIDWIFVSLHHPMFGASSQHSYNSGDSVGAFMQLFQNHKISFVFAGHNHNWQRTYQVTYNASSKTNPNIFDTTSPYTAGTGGFIHVVSGTGGHDSGSSLYSLGSQPAFQAYQNRTNNGIFELVASNNGQTLTCSFVNTGGSKFDTFVINSG